MREIYIIHDGNNNFLGLNLRSWIPELNGDVFQGTYGQAIKVARKLKRRVFVSSNYGYNDQEDIEILANGRLGEVTCINERA